MSTADFFKLSFPKDYFMNTFRMSSSLDQDQAPRFAKPDLGRNCSQRLSADETVR